MDNDVEKGLLEEESIADNYYYLWEKDNINVLFKNIYDYYVNKGFIPIILRNIITILQLSFLTIFIVFATTCIEWDITGYHNNALKCYSLKSIFDQEFSWILISFMIIMCIIIGYKLSTLPNLIKKNYKTKKIYNYIFGIQDKELQTLTFSEIVTKIKHINNKVLNREDKLSDLDIINIIMIIDNYMIALINKEILNLTLPCLKKRKIITKVTELGLFGSYGIPGVLTMTLFNDDNTINQHFVFEKDKDKLTHKLRQRFRMVGLILLIIAPVLLIYLIGRFLFKYAEQIKNQPSFLATREWNLLAKYKFRDFNELPHSFNERLNKSYEPAKRYVSYFDSPVKTMIFEFLIFAFGAIFVIFMGILTWETIVIGNISVNSGVILAITILGATIGILRSNMPSEHKVYEYNKTMNEIVKHIHYIPMEWVKNAHHINVLNHFTQLFSYKILNWFLELTSIIYMPFIFMYSLANSSEEIVDFMQKFTVHHPKAGNICKFAMFNLRDNGNEEYGSLYMPDDCYEMSQYGKLEMSLINFKETFPAWELDESQKDFLDANTKIDTDYNPDIATKKSNFSMMDLYKQSDDDSMAFSEMLETIKDQTKELEMSHIVDNPSMD